MPVSFPFSRPFLPYESVQKANAGRSTRLASGPKRPFTGEIDDADKDYIIDVCNWIYTEMQGIAAGIIPGSDVPENDGKLPTTDGQGNISWVFVNTENLQNLCVTTQKYALQSITADQVLPGSLTGDLLVQNTITGGSVGNIGRETIEGINIKPETDVTIHNLILTGSCNLVGNLVVAGNVTAAQFVGVWNGGIIPPPKGGTGFETTTAYGVICGGTTPTGVFQNTGLGAADTVLRGTGALPQFGKITTNDMNDNVITTNKINGMAVTTAKINNDAVTLQKLGVDVFPDIKWISYDKNSDSFVGLGIASLQKLGTGRYRIQFMGAMTNANYAAVVTARSTPLGAGSIAFIEDQTTARMDVAFGTFAGAYIDSSFNARITGNY